MTLQSTLLALTPSLLLPLTDAVGALTLTDLSGNGCVATPVNLILGARGLTAYTDCARFDGTSYIQVVKNSAPMVPVANAPFTLFALVRRDYDTSGPAILVAQGDLSTAATMQYLSLENGPTVDQSIQGGTPLANSTAIYTFDDAVPVVVRWDGTTREVMVGSRANSVSSTPGAFTLADLHLYLGIKFAGLTSAFQGRLGFVTMFLAALSNANVDAVFTAAITTRQPREITLQRTVVPTSSDVSIVGAPVTLQLIVPTGVYVQGNAGDAAQDALIDPVLIPGVLDDTNRWRIPVIAPNDLVTVPPAITLGYALSENGILHTLSSFAWAAGPVDAATLYDSPTSSAILVVMQTRILDSQGNPIPGATVSFTIDQDSAVAGFPQYSLKGNTFVESAPADATGLCQFPMVSSTFLDSGRFYRVSIDGGPVLARKVPTAAAIAGTPALAEIRNPANAYP